MKCDLEAVEKDEYESALRKKLDLDLLSESDEMASQWNHKQFFTNVLPQTIKFRK